MKTKNILLLSIFSILQFAICNKVSDIIGRDIALLAGELQKPRTYEIQFSGNNLSSGVYFYSLILDGVLIDTKKLILLK